MAETAGRVARAGRVAGMDSLAEALAGSAARAVAAAARSAA